MNTVALNRTIYNHS